MLHRLWKLRKSRLPEFFFICFKNPF